MQRHTLSQIIADQQKRKRPQQPLIQREGFKLGEAIKKDKFIHILSGIRRCGKSTLLELIRQTQKEQDYYLNFDDDRLIDFQVNDFQKLYELFIEKFGPQTHFYFDEIQNVEGWERFVRRLYDEGNKVYLTGSNAHLLSQELGTHLTGRFTKSELYPFSFREYLTYKKIPLKKLGFLSTEERIKFKIHFSNYLAEGGFPEYLQTHNEDYLKQLYWSIIYKDIIVRYNLPHDKPLKELSLFLASNLGKPVSYNSLKKVIGAGSATTIKEYLEYFENSYLFFQINKYDFSLKKQIYTPKKVYSIDTRLAQQIGFRFSEDNGRYMENAVFLELKRRGKTIFYHQGKYECDFILKNGLKITEAIQVCVSLENPETRERELNGIKEAMETYKLNTGLILTDSEEGEEKIGRKIITILPIWKWMLQH